MQKGGIVQDTLEKLGELAKESGQAVATEPLKILQQALGENFDDEGSSDPLEQGVSGKNQQSNQQNQHSQSGADQLLVKKKLEDRDRVQQLLALHRERLKEEESFFEQSEGEKEQKKNFDKQEREQKRQEEIVQLQRQEEKDQVLSAPTQASGKGPQVPGAVKTAQKLKGTKEVGKSMAD